MNEEQISDEIRIRVMAALTISGFGSKLNEYNENDRKGDSAILLSVELKSHSVEMQVCLCRARSDVATVPHRLQFF